MRQFPFSQTNHLNKPTPNFVIGEWRASSVLAQDVAFYDTHKSGDMVARLSADVQEFKSSFKQVVSLGLRNITQTAGGVVSMMLISKQLTAALVLTVPLIIGGGTLFGGFLRGLSRESQSAASELIAHASEVIGNIRTVRAFGMEAVETSKFSTQANIAGHRAATLGCGIGVFVGLSNIFTNGMILSVLYFGGVMLSHNALTPGDLMGFLVSAQTIQRSLSNMSVLIGQTVRGTGAGVRIFEFIKVQPAIPSRGGTVLPAVQGQLTFNDVTFAYPSRPDQVCCWSSGC